MGDVAAAHAGRAGRGPDGADAVGAGVEDLDGVGPGQGVADAGHAGADALPGQGVAHEHDAPRGVAAARAPRLGRRHRRRLPGFLRLDAA